MDIALQIPGFRIQKTIYKSQKTEIFKGRRLLDNLKVVLKVSKSSKQQIRREFKLGSNIDSDHVIDYIDIQPYGNHLALIIEDFDAISLEEYLVMETMTIERFLKIALQICQGLKAIHQKNIIHKDIKPSNILIHPKTGIVKITDFGIANRLNQEHSRKQEFEGSFAYISPEQTGRISRFIDHRTDFYSLGVTSYQILTDQLPFLGKSPMEYIHGHLAKEPVHPQKLNSELSDALNGIILKLLAKSAEERYQSCQGLIHDLQWCIDKPGEVLQLGCADISEQFRIPQQLFGRDAQVRILLDKLAKIHESQNELILVSGYPGIGKTALVNEIRSPLTMQNGYFIQGSFSELNQDEPYNGIIAALKDLVRQVLGEPEVKISYWRMQLKDTLGENIQVLNDIVPDLSLIFGKHRPVAPLEPSEARNRFLLSFIKFLQTFARKDAPLVLFLDDLQWADPASFSLLENILMEEKFPHLLLIAACRNPEELPQIQESKVFSQDNTLFHLPVGPLSRPELTNLIANTLYHSPSEVRELSDLIAQKTEGNPLFVIELLKILNREKKVWFCAEKNAWEWDLNKIEATQVNENVVDFLKQKLMSLPQESRHALSLASAIGHYFDLEKLAALLDKPEENVVQLLWDATREGIIQPIWQEQVEDHGRTPAYAQHYRFQLVPVHIAAYEMLPAANKPGIHLKIGASIIKSMNTKERWRNLGIIAHHLNLGRHLIENTRERLLLARVNLRLAKKNKTSVAYPAAVTLLEHALELLPERAWETDYQLCFNIHSALAETTHLNAESDRSASLTRELLTQAKTNLEKVKLLKMRMEQHAISGRFDMAIRAGLEGLTLLGYPVNKNPSSLAIMYENLCTNYFLRKQPIATLANRPLLKDPTHRVLLQLLMGLTAPAHLTGNRRLYKLLTLKRVHISLRYGFCAESITAFLTYGSLLGIAREDFKMGNEFGKLALQLNERIHCPELEGRIMALYGMFIQGWNQHWQTLTPFFRKTIETSLSYGDLLFTSYACAYVNQWNPMVTLATAVSDTDNYLSILNKVRFPNIRIMAQLFQQYRLNLMGKTRHILSLETKDFNEDECFKAIQGTSFSTERAVYHLIRLQMFYTYEDYDSALMELTLLEEVKSYLRGMLHMVDLELYTFLILCKKLPITTGSEKRKQLKRMKSIFKRISKWARHCPVNYRHIALLCEAEFMRINEKRSQAAKAYDDGIAHANKYHFLRYEALIYESAAKFYQQNGQRKIASIYFNDARLSYLKWGAEAKAEHLQISYFTRSQEHYSSADQRRTRYPSERRTTIIGTTQHADLDTNSNNNLDLNAIFKAACAISEEINLEKLLQKILAIIIETTGAQRGFLILEKEEELQLVASSFIVKNKLQIITHKQDLNQCNNISKSIVRYVFRSGENVVLHNASKEKSFSNDEYLSNHNINSLLCTPINLKDQRTGVLYLENNLTSHAFTKERVQVVYMLLAQAAVSLENAELYTNMHHLNEALLKEVEERKQAEETISALNEDLERRVNERTAQLAQVQNELIERAHQAGMADIATSVLHNVGNILNSVITSSQLISGTIDNSRLKGISSANKILREHMDDLEAFIAINPKGKQLMEYYLRLEDILKHEHGVIAENSDRLIEKVNSIRSVIMSQQIHVSRGFQSETVFLAQAVDDALRVVDKLLKHPKITIEKHNFTNQSVNVQKAKLTYVLINLIKNAREAMLSEMIIDKTLSFTMECNNKEILLIISDTGVGIPSESLSEIFSHGFSTKPGGQGFGLHTSANYMTEMGCHISAQSGGTGTGASLILHFPVKEDHDTAKEEQSLPLEHSI